MFSFLEFSVIYWIRNYYPILCYVLLLRLHVSGPQEKREVASSPETKSITLHNRLLAADGQVIQRNLATLPIHQTACKRRALNRMKRTSLGCLATGGKRNARQIPKTCPLHNIFFLALETREKKREVGRLTVYSRIKEQKTTASTPSFQHSLCLVSSERM